MKIKLKIFSTFVLASMLLTIGGVSAFYYFSYKNLRVAAVNDVSIAAKNKAAWLSTYFDERIKDAEILANSPITRQVLNASDLAIDSQEYLVNFQTARGYSDILLIRADGEIWWSATSSLLEKNITDVVYRQTSLYQAYQKALESNHPVLSDYAAHPTNDRPALFLASPVYIGNQLVGAVALQIAAEQIDAIMQNQSGARESSQSYLVGSDYLMRSDTAEVQESSILKQSVNTENAEECFFSYQESVVASKDYRGVAILGTHVFIPEVGWCLLTEISQAEAFAPLNQLRWFYLLVGLALLLISYLVATWLSNKISRPIVALEKGTEIIARGDLKHRVATKVNDEVGQLSRAFDEMTDAIRDSRKEIDRKVKEQTKEIRQQQGTLERDHRIILDMLDQVKKEKLSAERERDKINAILHGIGDGVFFIDRKGHVSMFNKAAVGMSGFASTEVVGKRYNHALKFKYDDDKEVYHKFIEETIKSGKTREMPHHVLLEKKNGKFVPVNAIASLLHDEHGKVTGCVVVLRDMTKEEKVEKMKTEFVSLASHQLRTPLSAVRWFLEMLSDGDSGKLNKEQANIVEKIMSSNDRMISLVNGLLNIARIESGRMMVEPQPTDLVALTKSVLAELDPLIKAHRHTVHLKYDKLPHIKVDTKLINQVVINFLSNSIKYTPGGGKINITIDRVGKHVKWLVKDNGLGVPATQQEHVFKKFFRAGNVSGNEFSGTGLGLYVVKQIVEASGGFVGFSSKEGKGSSFWFVLPMSGSKRVEGEKSLEYFGVHN